MKLVKKILVPVLAAGAALAMAFVGLTGCGGLATPGNFTFDRPTRAYSFDTVDGATSYQISINKVLNEATGRAMTAETLASIQRDERGQTITQPATTAAELRTMPGSSESKYIWTSFIANTLVPGSDEAQISGNLSIYRNQTRADGVTPVLLSGNPEELPLGHYYISCYAVDDEENELGVRCVAVAIPGADGRAESAFSISGLTPYMTPERIRRIAAMALDSRTDILADLGIAQRSGGKV